MDSKEQFYLSNFDNEGRLNIKEEISKYTRKWAWFILSIVIAVVLGFFYLRYTPKQYKVSTTILIKDDKKGGVISELSAFEDLGGFAGVKSNVDNEIEILKSRSILMAVVKSLQLQIAYFKQGDLLETELFGDQRMFEFKYAGIDKEKEESIGTLNVHIVSETSFELFDENKVLICKGAFGKQLHTSFGSFTLIPTGDGGPIVPCVIRLEFQPVSALVISLRNAISIGVINKKTSVVSIRMMGEHKKKLIIILDQLVAQYNKDAISDKNEIATNTADFINNRLLIITDDLTKVDIDVEEFKQANKLTDISSEAGLFLETVSDTQQQLLTANTQLQLVAYMSKYMLNNQENERLIPANLGFNDPAITALSTQFNTLVLDRNRLLKTSSKINPVVVNINDQLLELRNSLTASLVNLKAAKKVQIKALNKYKKGISSKIAAVPKQERVYKEIQRQQQIKEALYLYLLQKREETAISLAVTVANAKIIDPAYGSNTPVSPNRKIVFLTAFLLGLILPASVIYIRDLLDSKIHDQKDFTAIKVPFLGTIPKADKDSVGVIINTGNNSISEAFRILRTSVTFSLGRKIKNAQVIMVGSTISQEGKTFVAINLAASLAISGKKILLVGMDLRSPKLASYLNLNSDNGLVNFVIDENDHWGKFVNKNVQTNNLDVLVSGTIPPNPSELLMHARIQLFFDEVYARYDYVIIDTAPVGLVADTLLLSKYADLFVYISKANYSEKRSVDFIKDLVENQKITNLEMLLNGVDPNHGYGYGYGYLETTKKKRGLFSF